MATFNFAFVQKPVKKEKKASTSKEYKIIQAKVSGYIWIDVMGNYSVLYNDIYYNIKKENYKCFGKTKIYRQNVNNERICVIRTNQNVQELDNKNYLPFIVGSFVKGNIIEHNITHKIFFDIKYIPIVPMGEEGLKAYRFYKEHYDEIINNMHELGKL